MGNSASLKKSVIIVGSGYGGTAAAKALDTTHEVTLVNPTTTLQHKWSFLRGAVVPGWEEVTQVPLDKLLKNGKIVTGKATSVAEGTVTLEDGTVLTADYIILAHGLKAAFPSGSMDDVTSTDVMKAKLVEKQQAVRDAGRIVIVGAGPVGLELAGEIRAQYPDKTITVVHSRDHILSNSTPPMVDKFINKVNSRLVEMNIDVVLNARVTDAPEVQNSDGFVHGTRTYTLSNGSKIEADLMVLCVGNEKPESNLVQAVDTNGRVKVDLFFKVEGMNNVFCIGDANNLPETNLGYHADMHGNAVAKIIQQEEKGKKATPYKPASGSTEFGTMFLPLGPNRGVAAMQKTIMGDGAVSKIKGKGLFKNKVFGAVNATPPQVA